jgi:hypothetical protein
MKPLKRFAQKIRKKWAACPGCGQTLEPGTMYLYADGDWLLCTGCDAFIVEVPARLAAQWRRRGWWNDSVVL